MDGRSRMACRNKQAPARKNTRGRQEQIADLSRYTREKEEVIEGVMRSRIGGLEVEGGEERGG